MSDLAERLKMLPTKRTNNRSGEPIAAKLFRGGDGDVGIREVFTLEGADWYGDVASSIPGFGGWSVWASGSPTPTGSTAGSTIQLLWLKVGNR